MSARIDPEEEKRIQRDMEQAQQTRDLRHARSLAGPFLQAVDPITSLNPELRTPVLAVIVRLMAPHDREVLVRELRMAADKATEDEAALRDYYDTEVDQ